MAVSVRVSTLVFRRLSFSLCDTPKRCSSSTTKSPKSLKWTSLPSILWVPISTSTRPSFTHFKMPVCSALLRNRLSISILTAKFFMRCSKLLKCCSARMVVGTKYATCFPDITALKTALIATSVFPYPTSPQSKRSMGLSDSISFFISSLHLSCPGVSSYENASSNWFCHRVSRG